MSTPAVYRFLPFTRRGLVAELRDSTAAAQGALPQRASIRLDLTLSDGLGGASTTTALAGPGDVVGLDPRSIVRLTPRRDATNVEPNYLVAVDFDEPDLPWLLTPAAADARGRLRPWLALVVVEARPGVSIDVPAGAPLPQLRIDSGASRELGDLAGSWAWAHTQLLVAEGSGQEAAGAMQSDPDRHVSRLLCPRRLKTDGRWFACLVPAFDAGVRRGLGLAPLDDQPLAPAWSGEDQITLPLYFHWEFSTGPAGDFESLARRLQPFKVGDGSDGTPTVGTVKMHIGAAGGPVDLPAGDPARIVEMDGALRAVQQRDGRLDEIPTALTTPLGELLDAIADPSGSDPDDGAVGPPLYGAWAINRFRVATTPGWFRELNLDPRARVAAGLGTEVVRREQEDLMTACWEQVGSVLAANALLSRSELSIQASTRLHERTIARLEPARALTYAAPLSGRTPLGETTVRAAIGPTSLPDTTVDPALRRLVAPTGRFVRKAAADRPAAAAAAARFVANLAAGSMAVDPTDFVPAGVVPPSADPPPPPPPPDQRLALKADLRAVGLITSRHAELVQANGAVFTAAGRQVDPLLQLREVASTRAAPASGFVLGKLVGGGLGVELVDRTIAGDLVLRTAATEPNEVVARVSGRGTVELGRGVVLPPDAIAPGRPPIDVRLPPGGGDVVIERPPIVRPPLEPPFGQTAMFEGPTVTVPPLVRDAPVLARFEAAIAQLADVGALTDVPPGRQLVPYALDAAAQSLVARCHPSNAHVARVGSMVHFGDTSLSDLRGGVIRDGVTLAPTADRIMAYPELAVPGYRLLARYDRTRLLPGVDAIPPDSVTLLETNPRFVAAFLAGLNHEVNRELLWRRYPTDQRGTPVRRFWDRLGGPSATDVPPMHQWAADRSLVEVAGGQANLVLLLRGELLRRYPNTVVLAIPASGPGTPSTDDTVVKRAIFAGVLDPDVAFFGFDLVDADLRLGDGWFFAIQEQITEPRFGLDESRPAGALGAWRQAAWPDTGIDPATSFTVEQLRAFATANGLQPVPGDAATVAEALFQHPVQVLVHARHLALTEEV
jgi:hypothetical protein